MTKAEEIARVARDRLRAITQQDTDLIFDSARGILTDLKGQLEKKNRLEVALVEEEALTDFTVDLNKRLIETHNMNDQLGVQHIDNVGNALIAEQKDLYAVLGDNYELKQRRIIDDAKLRFLTQQQGKMARTLSLDQTKKVLGKIANSSTLRDPLTLNESLDKLHAQITDSFGEPTADTLINNTKNVITLRKGVFGVEESAPLIQPPIITSEEESIPLNTHLDTKITTLKLENPMLLRGFLRIHDMKTDEALEYIAKIREEFPDSPEPDAMLTALNLREGALQKNPLQYGADQMYYYISSQPVSTITLENDHRFNASQEAYVLFGRTNFFTEKEKMQLKGLDFFSRSKIFKLAEEKLRAFNSTQKIKIPTFFMKEEMNRIDPIASTWVEVQDGIPATKDMNLNDVVIEIENIKKQRSEFPLKISSQLLGAKNIGNFVQQAVAADAIITDKNLSTIESFDASNFFTTHETYAYLNKYEDTGGEFQNNSRKLIVNAVSRAFRLMNVKDAEKVLSDAKTTKLRNIEADMFQIYNADGTPYQTPIDLTFPDGSVFEKGSVVKFSGSLLSAFK